MLGLMDYFGSCSGTEKTKNAIRYEYSNGLTEGTCHTPQPQRGDLRRHGKGVFIG